MKKILLPIIALSSICFFSQCTKPTDGIVISVNPKIFDNTVAIKFFDGAKPGQSPANVQVTITGDAANSVYEISGTKTYKVVDGILALGVLPTSVPGDAMNAANFIVTAEAPGYLTVRVPIKVFKNQPTKLVTVSMVNTTTPPHGVAVKKSTVALTNGATTTSQSMGTPVSGSSVQYTTVDIPAGTSFKDASGNTLTGTTLNSTIVNFGTDGVAALSAFPGGSFHSDAIKDQNGATVGGNFRTSGFCNIEMTVGTADVKNFSQPITLHMGLNPTQINPSTGAVFAVGDQIPVWSYQIATGQWSYEQVGTVINNSGSLEVAFQTSHLTYYNLAYLDNSCSAAMATFNTGAASAESYLVDIYPENETKIPAISGFVMQVNNGGAVTFEDVPEGNVTMKIYRNTAANSQTDWTIRDGSPLATYTGVLCGTNPTITLATPTLTTIKFDISGQCPSNATKSIVRPTTDVWYRITGSNTDYQLLGQVVQGKFETTNINYQSTYDFKVIWGGSRIYLKTKLVDSTSYQRTIIVPANEVANFCN